MAVLNSVSALTLMVAIGGGFLQIDPEAIRIIDTGQFFYVARTNFTDLGPQVGDILNAHYFPALKYYEGGRYSGALPNLNYVIERPTYINGNPEQAQYMSTAHYVRGMIYFYHATGIGRLSLAMKDFEAAIRWNAKNYLAYLELSRVFSKAGLRDQAIAILQGLLDQHPEDPKAVEEVRHEIDGIMQKVPTDPASAPKVQLP